jgi:hypothetical protein
MWANLLVIVIAPPFFIVLSIHLVLLFAGFLRGLRDAL